MAFEFCPTNIEQEIIERRNINEGAVNLQGYSETEIWYIIEMLVNVMAAMKASGNSLGDIQPKNLMVDSNGFIKIADNTLINYGETGYLRRLTTSKYKAALSPKLMTALPYNEVNPIHDEDKSDMFSMGITALCAAHLKDIDFFYNFGQNKIEWEQINNYLARMGQLGYSQALIDTIGDMVQVNESTRLGCLQLKNYLDSHSTAIKQGIPFSSISKSALNSPANGRRQDGNVTFGGSMQASHSQRNQNIQNLGFQGNTDLAQSNDLESRANSSHYMPFGQQLLVNPTPTKSTMPYQSNYNSQNHVQMYQLPYTQESFLKPAPTISTLNSTAQNQHSTGTRPGLTLDSMYQAPFPHLPLPIQNYLPTPTSIHPANASHNPLASHLQPHRLYHQQALPTATQQPSSMHSAVQPVRQTSTGIYAIGHVDLP